MSLGDLPRFPRKYKPRGDRLVEKLEQSEITEKEVMDRIFSSLGTLTVNSSGIKVGGEFGAFEVGNEIYPLINGFIDALLEYVGKNAPEILRKRFSMMFQKREERKVYIRFGGKIFKFTPHALYVGAWKATEDEVADTEFPLIEIIPTERLLGGDIPIFELFESYISNKDLPRLSDYLSLKIYRLEKMIEWFDFGWEDAGEMLGMVLPMMSLFKKETLDKLGVPYPAFWDDVFTKCGV